MACVVVTLALLGIGCGGANSTPGAADAGDLPAADAGAPGADATLPGPCAAGADGLDCLLALVDEVSASCDTDRLADLRTSLTARAGTLPAWYQGEALFVSYDAAVAVAGAFNDWQTDTLVTASLCGSDIYLARTAIASGRYPYKVVRDGVWSTDPLNWGFAYDDYAGNPDGKNSVLNTYDSGLGHLVQPAELLCSDELGNCRPLTTYLPPGYGAPANAGRRYPVVFMHDGQNIFDDTDCCFGHTGWEINVTLDSEIAAGRVEPVVVVGFDHGGAQRGDEYAYPAAVGGMQETFMQFQVDTVQPTAASYWRLDNSRYYVAGSSFGGLVSLTLAFKYPEVYVGAASLSGAFWPNQDENLAMRDIVAATGKVPVSLYLDHGGSAATGADGYADNTDVRDLVVAAGWKRSDSPNCVMAADSLCYYHDEGATHDELAWRARAYRFLRYFFAAQ